MGGPWWDSGSEREVKVVGGGGDRRGRSERRESSESRGSSSSASKPSKWEAAETVERERWWMRRERLKLSEFCINWIDRDEFPIRKEKNSRRTSAGKQKNDGQVY